MHRNGPRHSLWIGLWGGKILHRSDPGRSSSMVLRKYRRVRPCVQRNWFKVQPGMCASREGNIHPWVAFLCVLRRWLAYICVYKGGIGKLFFEHIVWKYFRPPTYLSVRFWSKTMPYMPQTSPNRPRKRRFAFLKSVLFIYNLMNQARAHGSHRTFSSRVLRRGLSQQSTAVTSITSR